MVIPGRFQILTIVSTVLLVLVVACATSSDAPPSAGPTPDIEATVEARVQEALASTSHIAVPPEASGQESATQTSTAISHTSTATNSDAHARANSQAHIRSHAATNSDACTHAATNSYPSANSDTYAVAYTHPDSLTTGVESG